MKINEFASLRELYVIITLFSSIYTSYSQSNFVYTKDSKFYIQNKEYKFIGTNYWYGGFLALDIKNNGKKRLRNELDFLQKQGITNLRVLFSSEGDSSYHFRVSPSIQEKLGEFNEEILKSFDYFLVEAAKRNMKIVFILNNNWEWSGGFGQYLEWTGNNNPILPKTDNWDWDKYCDYISKFYSCDSCQIWFRNFITKVINRKNSISKIDYREDPTIMTWELANEPRPMRKSEMVQYKSWVKSTSKFIKNIDSNHLVTIGVEGIISTALDTNLFVEIYKYTSIDYATIHLWPKTWRWYNGESVHSTTDSTLKKTAEYIQLHANLCREMKLPLVIEEFGLHRDENKFEESATTKNRDKYFDFIYKIGKKNNVSGYNFWGAFAYRDNRLTNDFWKYGLPYTADPPQEEQGLYGVYINDWSTWNVIRGALK